MALALALAAPAGGRVVERACALVRRHYWNGAALDGGFDAGCRALAAAPPPARADLYARLDALLDGVGDSHLFAIDPVRVRLERARDRGRAAGGVGLDLLPDADGRWRVARLGPDGPAARAGVGVGWEVLAVDGAPPDPDWDPAPGATVRFRFRRPDGTEVARALVAEAEAPLPTRRATPLGDGLLLVALDGFAPGDDRWLRATLAGARPAGVVLDLRGNDGGDGDVVARVAGAWFPADRPLVERIGRTRSLQRTVGAGPASYRGPLAVLVGPESASGAEALAALLADSGRAATLGARTAGALTGAATYRLPDGGELSVPEFDLRLPDGRRLEGVGLAPQVAVAPTPAERRAGADPALARAVALLRRRLAAREVVGAGPP